MPSARRVDRTASSRRVLGYARVSSEEQAKGTSLVDQQNAIKEHAESRGLKVTKFYVEAESAVYEKLERRDEMRRLMNDAQQGDLVLCAKLDRWSRDPEVSYRTIRELREKGVAIYFVMERIDPSTDDGDSFIGMRILFAKEEHKRIRERLVGTRRILRNQGYYVEGLPPFGYRRSKPPGTKGLEKNILVINDEQAKLVQLMFAWCIAGKPLSKISERVELKVFRVQRILETRTYIGEIENSNGEWIAGKHPAIVDADTFQRARDALKARTHGGRRSGDENAETATWILRDVAVCGLCGAKMGAAYAGPHEARRYYYRCIKRCTTSYVPVKLVEMAFTPLVLDRLAEMRDELGREPVVKTIPFKDDGKAKRAKLEQRRARYIEMYADGVMTREAMHAAVRKADDELLRLTAAKPKPSALEEPAMRRSVLRDVAMIEKAWRQGDGVKRRELVNHITLRVGLKVDDEPRPTWRSLEDMAMAVE